MKKRILRVVYIRSSKYDDEGYVHRFWRGVLPSNTLMCLKSLTRDVADSGLLGDDVRVEVECFDDTVEHIPVRRLARQNRRRDTQVLVGLAGVQSNQFTRAAHLALEFRAAGIPVMIGGFHVSGMLAMFDAPSRELQELLDHGVTLVKGEAESPGVMVRILQDALHGELQPIYDIKEPPCLTDAPVPVPEKRELKHFFMKKMATIDTSRGCPFKCSFCTVINVQGRKMRNRSAECVLKAIKTSCERCIYTFFFTDDNFSRNPAWESLFDGLIALRQKGTEVKFMMQVDTAAAHIPRFVEKAAQAGCYRVFVGMESLNADNLAAADKKQNHIEDYAAMVQAWHDVQVLVYVGYIIGFPHDTPASVQRDMENLKSHVKVDKASFFMLTPLPGSRDHQRMVEELEPLDADLNNYDSVHETFRHPHFAPGEWAAAYHEAWASFYNPENMVNVLLRAPRKHYWPMFWTFVYFRYCTLTHAHPMLTGLFPIKGWKRRPDYPRESRLRLLGRRLHDFTSGVRTYGKLFFEFQEIWMLTRKPADPRWETLADLRERWSEVRQQLHECSLCGHTDKATEEARAMLAAASARLRQLSEVPRFLSGSMRGKLRQKAAEVDAYLRHFELELPSRHQVTKAEQYITESVLASYEEVAIRYVAQRRRFNAYRHDLIRRLKRGHILSLNVGGALHALLFEVMLGIRFGLNIILQP